MRPFELVLIALVLGSAGVLLTACVAACKRQWRLVRLTLGSLLMLWVVYLLSGAIVAMATPQRIQPVGSERCFDEMCFAVTGFERTSQIAAGGQVTQARGIFYIVSVRMSNQSRGRAQHEAGRTGMLVDQTGQTWFVSAPGMRAMAGGNRSSSGLEAELSSGEDLVVKLVFDLPLNVEHPAFTLGNRFLLYPPRIVIADDMHFLHKPTITPLE